MVGPSWGVGGTASGVQEAGVFMPLLLERVAYMCVLVCAHVDICAPMFVCVCVCAHVCFIIFT